MVPYSVVIPAYNAADTIAEALQSALVQDPGPARVVVVDDGSTDATPAVIAQIGGPIDYVHQTNSGPGAATTRGLAMVETPLVAGLDADDVWLPGKIKRQIEFLTQHREVAAVFGRLVDFFQSEADASYERPYDNWGRTTMLIHTPVAIANGPMVDPSGKIGDMVDWIARLREAGHLTHVLPEVVALRRLHANNLTRGSQEDIRKAFLQIAREAMLRRRKGPGG